MTRLPLLYVDAEQENPSYVTGVLTKTVQKLSQKHLYVTPDEDSCVPEEELNMDGIQPVTITFQSLEIDGANNNVLSTVGRAEDEGAKNLRTFVYELQSSIEARGWKTSFPLDPHESDDESPGGFRPRIPFMELPKSFDRNLIKLKRQDTEIPEEDMKFLSSEEGGNGISPIFWCQWWDDTFGRNIRLREVGIFPRIPGGGIAGDDDLSYSSFFLPYETIALPDGFAGMAKNEKRFQKYQEERMAEEQKQLASGKVVSAKTTPYEEPDMLMSKTRDRLEKIYIGSEGQEALMNEESRTQEEADRMQDAVASESEEDDENDILFEPITASPDDFIDDWMKERIQNVVGSLESANSGTIEKKDKPPIDVDYEEDGRTQDALVTEPQAEDKEDDDGTVSEPITASPDDVIDDWMMERIQNVVGSLESVKSRTPVKKDKPSIEDNPVFKAYKDGTLVPKSQKKVGKKRELPPYPSREHFFGIWQIVASPTGFAVEESGSETSENLILRVDGTTAGGPVLDPATNQKAAGGTWRMIEDGGDVKLRIRLVIPPKKERVIEMIGSIDRVSVGTNIPMASKAFGVPHLEAMAKASMNSDMADMMQCSGEVFIEDAITKKNREDVGTFSLMKLQGPMDKSQYTITIPKPIRNQD
eukprot:CAMPEP_0117009290 /NCGR_PEP_ID=MMETSP0472-20121206/8485_1 /TAXON_ID=693140 ORGANISM="Tiarina fusus, Strain LIS" /NCGR_SAMPLE_ID=MMETSP0472 /ASSEMBLY_ACC=CAM_ASM_000603 /LENGTH=644 /DNA_ID=CAMNT_0004711541 /DNA_START=487 /DNA_END=2421 /DNA_ORIENTATION=-